MEETEEPMDEMSASDARYERIKARDRAKAEQKKERAKTRSAPDLLRDYRHVWNTKPSPDDTIGQQALRKLLTDNPKDFLTQMSSMEKQFALVREKINARASDAGEKMGTLGKGGSGKAYRLLDKLMAKWIKQSQN